MQIGKRVECNGEYGIVKYLGTLSGYQGQWLGIDWDNEERGKHDGSVNGQKLFDTRTIKSGSFVRLEKINFGISFKDAILQQYCGNNSLQVIDSQFINRSIELVGFDKIQKKQSNIQQLKVINLREKRISKYDNDDLDELCANVIELDISKNLLHQWSTVLDICRKLRNLTSLNVSENRLVLPSLNSQSETCNHLKILICNKMWINSLSELSNFIATSFPNLEELFLESNQFTDFNVMEYSTLPSLKTLSLQDNDIGEWFDIEKISLLFPKLDNLNLSNIKLQRIGNISSDLFPNLKTLSISDNNINEWQSITNLSNLENLENLKILRNPVLVGEYGVYSGIIIARIRNLKILNGAKITKNERKDAEYDYVKNLLAEYFASEKDYEAKEAFLSLNPRFYELIQDFDIDLDMERSRKPEKCKNFVRLKIQYDDKVIERKFLYSMYVSKFRFCIQRICKLVAPPKLVCIKNCNECITFELTHDLRCIDYYGLEDNDEILVLQRNYKALAARQQANLAIYSK